jgi:hypothetical protein
VQENAAALNFGEARLDALQRHSFEYFLRETNLANGLVADKSQPGSPASITAVGFALAAYPVGVERGWMTRQDAVARTLTLLRFFWASPQGKGTDATGYKGCYYHFLDMNTGRRRQRIAAPRVGGMTTAPLLSMFVVPAAYLLLRRPRRPATGHAAAHSRGIGVHVT